MLTPAGPLNQDVDTTLSEIAANQTSGLQKTQVVNSDILNGIAGFTVTGYDYIALTYVTEGYGVGEIETVTFKNGGSGGTTIAILTITYNADNEISTITKT